MTNADLHHGLYQKGTSRGSKDHSYSKVQQLRTSLSAVFPESGDDFGFHGAAPNKHLPPKPAMKENIHSPDREQKSSLQSTWRWNHIYQPTDPDGDESELRDQPAIHLHGQLPAPPCVQVLVLYPLKLRPQP